MHVDEVAAPATINDAVAVFKRWPMAIPWAGGTLLFIEGTHSKSPVTIIDLGQIAELKTVFRTDRYLEIGSCVCLADILELPATLALEPLRSAIAKIGSATIRNIATIGGNISSKQFFMTCFAPLACMDASLEVRDRNGSRWMSIQNFVNQDGSPYFPASSILSKIRIPIKNWDAAAIRVLGEPRAGELFSASFAASARIENDIISELRLLAAGKRMARDRNLELSLTGKRLPISKKDMDIVKLNGQTCAENAGFSKENIQRFVAYLEAFLGASLESHI